MPAVAALQQLLWLPLSEGMTFHFSQTMTPLDGSYTGILEGLFTGEDLNSDGFINLQDDEVFSFAAVFSSTGPVSYFEFDVGVFTILEEVVYEIGSLKLGDNSEEKIRMFRASLAPTGGIFFVGYLVNDNAIGPGGACESVGLGPSFPCSVIGTDAIDFNAFSQSPVTVVENPETSLYKFQQSGYSDGSVVYGQFEALDFNNNGQISSFLGEVVHFEMTFSSPTYGTFTYNEKVNSFGLVYDIGSGFIGDGTMLDVEGIEVTNSTSTLYAVGDGPDESQLCDGISACAMLLLGNGDMLTTTEPVSVEEMKFYQAVLVSDPHIRTLFDGRTIDFVGEPRKVYNLLTHKEKLFSVLARFDSAYATGMSFAPDGTLLPYQQKGTWMSSVAIALVAEDGQVFLVVSSEDGEGELRYGSLKVFATTTASPLSISTRNKENQSLVMFNSSLLDGAISVVPPQKSWRIQDNANAHFTHINFELHRVSIAYRSDVNGIFAIGASDVPVVEANFEADLLLDAELLSLVP